MIVPTICIACGAEVAPPPSSAANGMDCVVAAYDGTWHLLHRACSRRTDLPVGPFLCSLDRPGFYAPTVMSLLSSALTSIWFPRNIDLAPHLMEVLAAWDDASF